MNGNHNNIVYSIVSTVRNEVKTIKLTLDSVVSQSIKPTKWVIIDDGSSDGTSDILGAYANEYAWIDLINLEEKNYYDYESAHSKLKVGFERILKFKNDYIVKLDGDLSFGANYFEEIFKRFENDPKLGIAGGWFSVQKGDKLYPEDHPVFHVGGKTKVYRWDCWQDIDGLVFKLGYDTIDEVKANMLGWKTKSFAEIKGIHHKKMGASHGLFKEPIYRAKVMYLVGYHPLYALAKSIKRMFSKPYIIGGIALFGSFIVCYTRKLERSISDKELLKYLRKQQVNKLLLRPTIWK